jgi:hypothetical protein
MNIWESTAIPNFESRSSLESVKVQSLTLSFIPRLPLLAFNLGSPCLGYKPKVRVATFYLIN